jgi:hypothetical protein
MKRDDVTRLHHIAGAVEVCRGHQLAGASVDCDDHAGAVQPVQRNVIQRRSVSQEMPRGIDVRSRVHHHLHLGNVDRHLRHLPDLLKSRLREKGDAGHARPQWM